MSYISTNYINNSEAPIGKWACAPSSSLDPFSEPPSGDATTGGDLCGQCVSYVKTVCRSLPATELWRKGAPVKNNIAIVAGTVIATFNASNKYEGHAAIYVSQSSDGINVYDQYITSMHPKAVGPRLLKWGAQGNSNNGENFCIVD